MKEEPMEVPKTYDDLRTVLQERMAELAPGQQRIATLLLSDPEGTSFRTITETARLADVHESSLVRFASLLGLKGYPSLVALCRQHLAQEAQLVARFSQAQQHTASGEFLSATVDHERDNLLRTFTRITPDQWDRALKLMDDANHIHIMGLRKCMPVAQLMTYLLKLVRPNVHLVAPVTGMLADEFRDLGPGDVFVAVSIRRYTAATVAAFQEAHRLGLSTIALTDDAASPLARTADVTFMVDSEGPTILRSVSAFISLSQALATGVAIKNGTRTRAELQSDEELLEKFGVYWDDRGG